MEEPNHVYLCTDTFTMRRSYYVIATSPEHAKEGARGIPLPAYLGNEEDDVEHLDTTVDEEVIPLILMRRTDSSSSGPASEHVRLIPTHATDLDVYRGYLVEERRVDVFQIRTYPKAEWQSLNSPQVNVPVEPADG